MLASARLILLLPAVLLCASLAHSQEKIKISHSAVDVSNAVWYVAQDRGFYKKNGLDVELIFIPSTTTSIASFLAGDIPVGNASGGGVASADAGGANLVLAGCFLNTLPYELVVQESIKSAGDLKGKSIGISRVGSSSDVAAHALIKGLGLEPNKDVPFCKLAALQRGRRRFAPGESQAFLHLRASSIWLGPCRTGSLSALRIFPNALISLTSAPQQRGATWQLIRTWSDES